MYKEEVIDNKEEVTYLCQDYNNKEYNNLFNKEEFNNKDNKEED